MVPIGEELIRRGLEREIAADFYVSTTRPPTVYRGNPFVIEVGLAYGGSLRRKEEDHDSLDGQKSQDKSEGPITLVRFANRVPLQYQQSACAIFKTVVDTNWKQYGLSQPKGGLPMGPMVLLVHMASVWVPFTSESKEAIAHYPDILKEMRLALQVCGRKLGTYLRSREQARLQARRHSILQMYVGELALSLSQTNRKECRRDPGSAYENDSEVRTSRGGRSDRRGWRCSAEHAIFHCRRCIRALSHKDTKAPKRSEHLLRRVAKRVV